MFRHGLKSAKVKTLSLHFVRVLPSAGGLRGEVAYSIDDDPRRQETATEGSDVEPLVWRAFDGSVIKVEAVYVNVRANASPPGKSKTALRRPAPSRRSLRGDHGVILAAQFLAVNTQVHTDPFAGAAATSNSSASLAGLPLVSTSASARR